MKQRNYVAKHMPTNGAGRHESKKGLKASRARQNREWYREQEEILREVHENENEFYDDDTYNLHDFLEDNYEFALDYDSTTNI